MSAFDDLLLANENYAASFDLQGFDGVARAGIGIVTCMDSRIDPLGMVGLRPGDAKILRNPGGRVTDAALTALVLGANLLNVNRVLIVQHTRCAVANASEDEVRQSLTDRSGVDAHWMSIGVITEPDRALAADVARVRTHPLIGDRVLAGGFRYDVDNGRLTQIV